MVSAILICLGIKRLEEGIPPFSVDFPMTLG